MVAFVLLTTLAYLQWIERKVIAHIQLRVGPYRVGPHGLLQPLADVIKLITKEGLIPSHVNKFFYLLAPFLAVDAGADFDLGDSVRPRDHVFGRDTTWMQLTDLQHRHAVRAGRFFHRRVRRRAGAAGLRITNTRCWAACAARRR